MDEKIFLEEEKKLLTILEFISQRLDRAEISFNKQEHFVIGFTEGLRGTQFNRQALMSLYATEAYQLKKILTNPYFGRMDFEHGNDLQNIYIGKRTLTDESGNVLIYDWRSPISSMYYDFTLGNAYYMDGDSKITGELLQKRQIVIKNSQLISVSEQDTLTDDNILLEYLNAGADSRLKSIVATIQKEQNKIIRNPINKNYIIQGVAGSGKTTVALHRIAYLIYNESKNISESQFMILGPNEYFLNYISELLPDLDISTVNQNTFERLVLDSIDKKYKIEDKNTTLERVLSGELSEDVIGYKSSIAFMELIKKGVENYVTSNIKKPLTYHNIELTTLESISRNIFDNSSKVLNYNDRINTFIQKLKKRIKDNEEDIYHKIWIQYQKQLSILDNTDPRKQEILNNIKEARNEIKKGCPSIIKEYFKFATIKPLDLYKYIIETLEQSDIPDEIDINVLKQYTLDSIKNKKICHDDLAPLLYIKYLLCNIDDYKNYRHLVIDEAQDLSEGQYYILKKLFPNCIFDIFGDLNQSIYDYQSIEKWEDVIDNILNSNTEILYLDKGYRSTSEIVDSSNYILHQIGHELSKSVARTGSDISFTDVNSENSSILINQILEYLNQDYHSIAIICKDEGQTNQIYQMLKKENIDIHKISNNDCTYDGGLCIMPAALSKGLEFDAVIIENASEQNYNSNSRIDMKLLYVAMTRAMHALKINYNNELSLPLQKLLINQKNKVKLISK